MPQYELVTNILLDGEIKQAGSVVEFNDDQAQAYLERGSIKPAEGGSESTTPLEPQDPPAPTTEPPQTPPAAQPPQDPPATTDLETDSGKQPTPEQISETLSSLDSQNDSPAR